jgi:putative DNA methylase
MMTANVIAPKKLIEVTLPLDAINAESAKRKRKAPGGYPTTFHKWFAQRPVAAARAVIFAQMVNDPSWRWELEHPAEMPPNNIKASWAARRKRLFAIIEDLVKWENTTNEEILEKARSEIRKSWQETCDINKDHPQAAEIFDPRKLPSLCDPFAGSGAIPMEAQRLGIDVRASDLNPVAVLINKATLEIPGQFVNLPPANPRTRSSPDAWSRQWTAGQSLADDVRYYGQWMHEQAQQRVKHLYPPVKITAELAAGRADLLPLVGQELPVIAWIWARTVRSPNPAFRDVAVPLASTFVLSTKDGRESYIDPVIRNDSYHFEVKTGKAPLSAKVGTSAGKRAAFRCLLSGVPIDYDHIRSEGKEGRLSVRLMAMVVDGARGRVYLSPTKQAEEVAITAALGWRPDVPLSGKCRVNVSNYGFETFGDLFTRRQIATLSVLCSLIAEAGEKARSDSTRGDRDAAAFSRAIQLYLACAVSRVADYGSAFATWRPKDSAMRSTLASQAIPMTWDFAEGSPLASSSSGFLESVKVVAKAMEFFTTAAKGVVNQGAAQSDSSYGGCVISTDPPYYDNISYADLSDFFYVWLRHSLKEVFPDLLATIAVPKAEELIAAPHRHGGVEGAETFFLTGMTEVMRRLSTQSHPAVPITIYYAYKQSESESGTGTSSTGWETFLEAVNKAGLAVTGTWPMRTEGDNRQIGLAANALASSIVLVCRPRPVTAQTVARRTFLRELNQVLPSALDEMTRGSGDDRSPVAPVDLSQAIIGPGMAVFSKYAAVLEADGTPMTVQTALRLINRFLAEDDFDHDSQFCLHWFEQYGWKEGRFGEADTLARAKGTSVDGVKQSGVLFAAGGIVRLLKWAEYPSDWSPVSDARLPVWETLHHLIRIFKAEGESGAGKVLAAVAAKAEATRQLAYRLYTLCERAGWAEDARAYNEIITSWSAIESAAAAAPKARQSDLFG